MPSDCMYTGNSQYVPLSKTGYFSKLVVDYIAGSDALKPFYKYKPNMDGMYKALKDRKNFPINRKALVVALQKQYETLEPHPKVNAHINSLLMEDTFTITTAHQPNLATGYAYFVYKIMHTVVLAEQMKAAYPTYNFVPCYYIGSEDDDIDELGFFRYNDHSFKWQTQQSGAVGMMNTAELKPLFDDFFKVLGPPSEHANYLKLLLSTAYLKHDTIAQATQYLVHELFKEFGVVVIDPNDALLKANFSSIIQEELFAPKAQALVLEQSEKLSLHYKTQAYARPINLFYLKGDIRKRIEQVDEQTWQVVDTNIKWNKEDLTDELTAHPERFSPNVILRGLYQETILPNVAFIGGGAEVAYWFQLKPVFEYYNVFYPVVVLRQSAQIVTLKQQERLSQLGWDFESMFVPIDQHIDSLVSKEAKLEMSVSEEWQAIQKLITQLQRKAISIDANLDYSAAAVAKKMEKQIAILQHKIFKAEKKKHQVLIDRMEHLKQELFPKGSLQERYYTFMQEYIYLGKDYFKLLHQNIKPFGDDFLIIY